MPSPSHEMPLFPFAVPRGYHWLVERRMVGFEPFSALQPWYFLPAPEAFSVTQRWPKVGVHDDLFAFARRQDCDDIACFSRKADGSTGVLVIHGWTANGYDVVASYGSIWAWLKSVVDEIAEWAERPGPEEHRA